LIKGGAMFEVSRSNTCLDCGECDGR